MTRKIMALTIALILIVGMLSGCGGSQSNVSSASSVSSAAVSTASAAAPSQAEIGDPNAPWLKDGVITYPLNVDETISIFSANILPTQFSDFKEWPFYQGWVEKLGVKIDWQTSADFGTAFNLIIASNDLPDIFGSNISDRRAYVNDGYLLSLDDYKQYAPALFTYLESDPEVDRLVKSDDGTYTFFPFVRESDFLTVFNGPALRKDWLDELGLSVPETIEDYDTVARAFKEKYGAYYTLWDNSGNLASMGNLGMASGFNATRGYYVDDNGKVQLGAIDDNFRKFLEFMKVWYDDGILDKDFATNDSALVRTKVYNGESGMFVTTSGTLNVYRDAFLTIDTKADLIAGPYPVPKKGDKVMFSQMEARVNGFGSSITTACKNVPLACAVLDYGYTEAGDLVWNYGIEGVSYTMVNGKPTFTDLIHKSEYGRDQAVGLYIASNGSGLATIQRLWMTEQKNGPKNADVVNTWLNNTEMKKHLLSNLTPTPIETNIINASAPNIATYANQMYFKFIIGEEKLDDATWDAYVQKIKTMGLDAVLLSYQAAQDRKMAR